MPKRTIALISIIAIIAILLVVAAFMQLRKDSTSDNTPSQNTTTTGNQQAAEKLSSLSFNPQSITASSIPTQVEVIADTGGLAITGVQVELEYDPTKISNVQLLPATANSLFGTNGQVLIEEVRSEAGRVSYAVVINPSAPEVKGVGSIVNLSMTAVPGATGDTEIKFLDKSLVTMFGSAESVLRGTTPLSITLGSATGSGQIQQPLLPTFTPAPLQ